MGKSFLSDLVFRQARKYGDRVALKYRDYSISSWISVSWNKFAEKVKYVSRAMVALGIKEQENVGVFSQNMPECFYVDFGSYATRVVTIPLYATSSESQVNYIVQDASIRYVFVGEQYQYEVARRVQGLCKSLKQIIIFDSNVKKLPGDTNSMYFDDFLKLGDEE